MAQVQQLTPLQVRFVRLLEMNEQEAEQAVERELDDNPALVKVESAPAEARYIPTGPVAQNPPEFMPQTEDDSQSLYDYLELQLGEKSLPDRVAAVARYAIGNIDPNGYLERTPQAMIDDLAFGPGVEVAPAEMELALEAIRSLDPPGVGASSLREALLLQLERMPASQQHDDAVNILTHAFQAFTMKHTHRMVSSLHIPAERVDRAMELIRTLNPKPGSSFGGGRADKAAVTVPDFQVDTDDEGHITVSFPGRIPELAISESFEQAMRRLRERSGEPKPKDARFISGRFTDARDFINIMRQRRDTLYAVMSAIVKLQHDFFLSGDERDLHPMTLKDVAAVVKMDVSTVSRATGGKYVATSYGTFELRHFFSEGYEGEDGTRFSARSVEAALRELIENEDKCHPLSDEALCNMLMEKGYTVKRRTVAKYRDRLGFPVARLRRDSRVGGANKHS